MLHPRESNLGVIRRFGQMQFSKSPRLRLSLNPARPFVRGNRHKCIRISVYILADQWFGTQSSPPPPAWDFQLDWKNCKHVRLDEFIGAFMNSLSFSSALARRCRPERLPLLHRFARCDFYVRVERNKHRNGNFRNTIADLLWRALRFDHFTFVPTFHTT